jgi:hypothetical protein
MTKFKSGKLNAKLSPEPQKGSLIIAHDDPGVRAADKVPAIREIAISGV